MVIDEGNDTGDDEAVATFIKRKPKKQGKRKPLENSKSMAPGGNEVAADNDDAALRNLRHMQLSKIQSVGKQGGPEDDLFVDNNHPQGRLRIRNDLIAFANSFLQRWDEFAGVAQVSEKYGFRFEARQTEYNN